MPDGMIRADLGVKLPSHLLHADISSMSPGKLAKRFQFLSDEGDRLGELGDREGEEDTNEASFEAHDAVFDRPIDSLEDAMAVLIIAANQLFEAASACEFRADAAEAWISLGRVASFLANKEGLDPTEYGGRIIHSGTCGVPERMRSGIWISRVLHVGGRIFVSEQGEMSLTLPARTPENAGDIAEVEAEFSRLDKELLYQVLASDINDIKNYPFRNVAFEAKGRAWLVSKAHNGLAALHAVELPKGAVA